ncbi:MAG: flagellar protein FlaG [Treponema sp.]|jgi:flagellar protein FlaG|nr:flagellar protein FlaG [Treponema sp.]
MEVIMITIADSGGRVPALLGDPISENSRTRVQAVFDSRGSVRVMENAAPAKPPAGRNRELYDITKNLEQIGLSFNRRLQFVVDHKSNEISIKVIDRATDKVIKVLPPEELQRLHSRIEETIGFLFDETV